MKAEEVKAQAVFGDIAIIGLSLSMPEAKDAEEFWRNLAEGKESIRKLEDDQIQASSLGRRISRQKEYVGMASLLEGVDAFDAEFFNFTPYEAKITDPQHRLFLEHCFKALEDGAYTPEQYKGIIGVFGSTSLSTYLLFNLMSNKELLLEGVNYPVMIGNDKDFLASKVSYKLNLRGPSFTVQSACSSSLVAVHSACQSIMTGESDLALAGGVSITVPQGAGYIYQTGGILSEEGRCRPFDQNAAGTIKGNGVAVVLLKSLEKALEDHDNIYGVIKATAINNDGSAKVGYTAPSMQGQSNVIQEALGIAGLDPSVVDYIETHGTGTKLGDPIEYKALANVFRTGQSERDKPCAIGSLKSNIGHLDAAAGSASLVKTALMLKKNSLVPTLHFQELNENIQAEDKLFYVNTAYKELNDQDGLEYAGVSSFGIGGTNAHVILKRIPNLEYEGFSFPVELVKLSAKSPDNLLEYCDQLLSFLRTHENVAMGDLAFTLNAGRQDYPCRIAITSKNIEELMDELKGITETDISRNTRPLHWVLERSDSLEVMDDSLLSFPFFREVWENLSLEIQNTIQKELIDGEKKRFLSQVCFFKCLLRLGVSPDLVVYQDDRSFQMMETALGHLSLSQVLEYWEAGEWQRPQQENGDNVFIHWKDYCQEYSSIQNPEIKPLVFDFSGGERMLAVSDEEWFRMVKGSPHTSGIGGFSALLLRAWKNGATIDWTDLYKGVKAQRISLPGYVLEKKSYWIGETEQEAPEVEERNQDLRTTETLLGDIIAIWNELLGYQDIKGDDNYYDLGGESLTAVQIISKINNQFSLKMHAGDLIDYDTPQKLYDHIRPLLDDQRDYHAKGSLTQLRKGRSGKNLFLVHPAGGTVFCYVELSKWLKEDVSVYGIEFPEIGLDLMQDSMGALAADYIRKVREIQPLGPYLLGGYSFGGNVAFEMGIQLQKEGIEVADLVMFDSHPPEAYNQKPIPRERDYMKAFPMILDRFLGRALSVEHQNIVHEIVNQPQVEDMDQMIDMLHQYGIFPGNLQMEDLKIFFRVWKQNHLILKKHVPEDVFQGNIRMIRAKERESPQLLDILNITVVEKIQWKKYIQGDMILSDVGGDHYTMFGDLENVREMSGLLDHHLEDLSSDLKVGLLI